MNIKRLTIITLISITAVAGGRLDRANLELPRSIKALKLTASGIHIDGVIDETAWEGTNFTSNFVQRDPIEGDQPTEVTEFAVLYDDEFIYVAINSYDSDPAGIRSILSRRDEETPSDWVHIAFDSYGDNLTAFEFWLNPLGVKRDVRRYNDEETDENWDAIWEGEATIHSEGWSAEFRIPLRELRFSGRDEQTWGIQVYRHISRKNEDDYWTYWSKEEAGHVRHYGRLTNLTGIPRQQRIYVAPYTTGQYARSNAFVNEVDSKNYRMEPNLGVDMKFGVTNDLTLDVTVNPDFGQVEADPAELNLTDFETFYEEKRPFFIEGSNIFRFPLGFGGARQTLFYPRRIGRRPQRNIYSAGVVDAPSATTILVAGKLSGKTEGGTSIGVLNAVTAEEIADIRFVDQATEHEAVEPLTNYFAARLQQDYGEGRTSVGGIITSVNRRLDDPGLKYLRRDAYSAGLDFSHRFNNDTYLVTGMAAVNQVSGSPLAIEQTQRSSTHYYQRPGYKTVDTSATEMGGYTLQLSLDRIRGEHIRGNFRTRMTSPGFEANDMGYHGYVGQYQHNLYLQYREDKVGEKILRWRVNLNGNYQHTTDGFDEITNLGGNINANATFLNYWYLGGGVFSNAPAQHLFALWGGPALATDPTIGFFYTIRSDDRKALYGALNGNRFYAPAADIIYTNFRPSLTWRPTEYFSLTASAALRVSTDTWMPWLGYGPVTDEQTGETRFIMATLDQTTMTTTLRFDFTLTPDLTIQFYGSPYLDAGVFYDDKLVVDPLNKDFGQRYHTFTAAERDYDGQANTYDIDGDGVTNFTVPAQRDFNYKEFHSNLVLRWEYQTGSTIYLVWSSNMNHFLWDGDFNYGRDLNRLFGSSGENVLMIKASYLLNI